MKKLKITRLEVTRTIDVGLDELFGDLDDVINYLILIRANNPGKKIILVEKWSGYEDNYFEATYQELETYEEAAGRSAIEEEKRQWDEKEAAEEKAEHNKCIADQIKKLEKLKKQ